ncbi:Rv3235 family protein [Streptomyces sp. ACA25]|uniref:Rv3235 family protein n=1 Tax=Streptomyces sp. ACA25 TaxID=3022596 RepID=UPI002307A19C|nr:Rv3235 family protein [Streptomyces sp. ACA25]MDB1089464.1 Rv3235 family protein [Streptomyces sp. ACA25]
MRTTGQRGTRNTAPPRRQDPRRPGTAGARNRGTVRFDPARPQAWFAQQLMLVLSGQKPVHALLGHARERAYEQLGRLAPLAPLRPTGPDRTAPVLHRVGACRPDPGVIEAFARILAGGRMRAVAFRLERGPEGRWRCCAVELDVAPQSPR